MKLTYHQKALASLAGIIAVYALFIYLIATDVLVPITFIVAVIGCYPMENYLWEVAIYESMNTIRVLKSALPKSGFEIESTEWNNDKTAIRFHGKYQEHDFVVEAYTSSLHIKVFDLPWTHIHATDPAVPQLLEAINQTNADIANISIYMSQPDDNGNREINTISRTILPLLKPGFYLKSLMRIMLERQVALCDNFEKVRLLMNLRKQPVGFNITPATDIPKSSSGQTKD